MSRILKAFNVLSANFLYNIFGLITTLLAPKFLSLENYALYQSFNLYSQYAVLLQFGFTTGIFIVLGGLSIDDVSRTSQHRLFSFTVLLLLLSTLLIAFAFRWRMGELIIAFLVFSISYNLIYYFLLIFQATGELNTYSRYVYLDSFLKIAGIVLVVLTPLRTNGYAYIWSKAITNCIVLMIILFSHKELYFRKTKFPEFFISNVEILKIGFLFMSSSFLMVIMQSADRFAIQWFSGKNVFAMYSFAVTLTTFFYSLIRSLSVASYSFFAQKNLDQEIVSLLKKKLLMLSLFFPFSIYFIRPFIERFLPIYITSVDILSVLFLGIPFQIVMSIVYFNEMKAKKQDVKFLMLTLIGTTITLFLNMVIAWWKINSILNAIVTSLCFYVMYFLCSCLSKRRIKINFEIAYLLAYTSLIVSIYCMKYNLAISVIIGISIVVMTILFLFRSEAVYAVKKAKVKIIGDKAK